MLAIVFGVLCIILIAYIVYIQMQLRSINCQLRKRLTEHTRQSISLELISKELNTLAVNINKCLKAEENLRLDNIREEKRFKELIANISHDLRTPLTAIKGYQQLMEKGELSDGQKQKLKIAQKHADELGRLIEHFFEYSYLVNADPHLNIERINLTNLVTGCLAESVDNFEKNNLTVHFEGTSPVLVRADKELVTRIVQNLIRNCVQHSSSDKYVSLQSSDINESLQSGDIYVNLQSSNIEGSFPNENNAVMSFRNSINSDSELDAKKLFERFYTGDKARGSSTGLGLSIVKVLAQQMDGSVGAEIIDGVLDVKVKLPLYKI